MTQRSGDVSVSGSAEDRIAELRGEVAAFEAQLKELESEVNRLMQEEDIAAGRTFAQEIHSLRHDKMRVKVEILALQQKIRRLSLGYSEDAACMAADPANPFIH